jgi:ribose transport system permease protein
MTDDAPRASDAGSVAEGPRAAVRATPRPGVATRVLMALANSRELTLGVLIVLLVVGMTILYPNNFPTSSNLSAVLLNAAQNGILVTGMMLLMIGGVFDLSIGSILALAGVWAGVVVGIHGYPAPVGLLVGCLVGVGAGLINGLLVTRVGINALIATLGTLSIYRGLTYVTAGTGVTPIGDEYKQYGQAVFLGLQSPFWVMLVIVAFFAWAVARTAYFRQFYLIGGNARAAKLSGIRVARLTLTGFVIMGLLAGIAGVLAASRLNSAVVSAGIGVELSVITAAVLGGASLRGGEGSIIGGVLGVMFIALVQNAMIINSIGVFWQPIVTGAVLLLAVSLDRFKQRRRA